MAKKQRKRESFNDVIYMLKSGNLMNHRDSGNVLKELGKFVNSIGTRGGFDGMIRRVSPAIHDIIWP